MAELVGLIASVVTIAGALDATVKQAITFFKAQRELEKLQDDVENFTGLLSEIRDRNLASSSVRLTALLHHAQRTIDRLDCLIKLKLLVHKHGTSRTRRRSWFKHKSKVVKLHSKLENSKDDLLAMVNIRNLALNTRSETVLLDISRNATLLMNASTRLNERQEIMHRNLLDANQTVSLHTSTILGILSSLRDSRSLESLSSASSITYQGFLVDALDHGNAWTLNQFIESRALCSTESTSLEIEDNSESQPASYHPASPLELSENFWPESYTSTSLVPKIIPTAFYEESASAFSRINFYQVLYFQSPRRWYRFDMAIEIPRSSMYWATTRITKYEFKRESPIAPLSIPGSLLGRLQQSIDRLGSVMENRCIRLKLSEDDSIKLDLLQSSQQISGIPNIGAHSKTPGDTGRAILAYLNDLGCARYSENEVVQVALLEPPDRYAACVNGTLVEEFKSLCQPPTSSFLYSIQLLHCLREAQGIVRLVGVTVDTTKHHVKSYLVKMPDSKCEFLLHRASILSSSCAWRKIELWARQLVERISTVHSGGYVVGTLWLQRPPILVDTFEQLYLWRFERTLHISNLAAPFYPPEYRQYAKLFGTVLHETERSTVTSKFDIFQLGTLLWILAEGWSSGQSALSLKSSFYKPLGTWPNAVYTGTSTLPRLADSVPEYYRSVVELCRADDPLDRPSANDLLSLFPIESDPVEFDSQPQIPRSEAMNLDAMQKCRVRSHYCNYCWERIISLFYNCNTCDSSDFDICPACFDRGSHCLDQSHLLVEVTIGGLQVARRYHSSVSSSGLRSVIED